MARLRTRRRVVALGAAAVGIALLVGAVAIHGSLSGPEPPLPVRVEDGRVVALVATGDGQVEVLGSSVVAATPALAWEVVTDYPAFPRIFEGLDSLTAVRVGAERYRLSGFGSVLGWGFPLRVEVDHEPGRERATVRWDEGVSPLVVNRGSWTLEDLGAEGTRISYRLALEVEGIPNWLVRSVLRSRVGEALGAVTAEIERRRGAP